MYYNHSISATLSSVLQHLNLSSVTMEHVKKECQLKMQWKAGQNICLFAKCFSFITTITMMKVQFRIKVRATVYLEISANLISFFRLKFSYFRFNVFLYAISFYIILEMQTNTVHLYAGFQIR